jgi:hypothetical protein
MEIVAQWLDDLEDLIFVIPLTWERLRLSCLRMGFVASLALPLLNFSRSLPRLTPACAGLAALCVLVWLLALLGGLVSQLQQRLA